MSKIERALRKAEEEKRRKDTAESGIEKPNMDLNLAVGAVSDIVMAEKDEQHLSEHSRKIAAKLLFCCENSGTNDVVFVSAVSGEGKTTSAINCALSLCRDFNLSVCLVDCDLRNPKISSQFESNGTATIIEHLKGEAEIDSVIHPSPVRGLSIAYSRMTGGLALPLLNTARLEKLVQELRARFDFVIYDSAPILPVADTVVLSRAVSGIILIIEPGRTRRKDLEQVLEQIDREKIIGFIMNYKSRRMLDTYNYGDYYDSYFQKESHKGSENREQGDKDQQGKKNGPKR